MEFTFSLAHGYAPLTVSHSCHHVIVLITSNPDAVADLAPLALSVSEIREGHPQIPEQTRAGSSLCSTHITCIIQV